MRRGILVSMAVFALLSSQAASADGLSFDGSRPLFPHFFLALDTAQKQVIASANWKGVKYVELRLTPAQQAAARKEAGAAVPWLFAADRTTVEGDCTCGSYNLAVVIGDRLAVYNRGLGDHLSPNDLKAIEENLQERVPPKAARNAGGAPKGWAWIAEGQPRGPALDAVLSRLPEARFERTLPVTGSWRAFRVRLPALPRLGDESDQDYMALFSELTSISATPLTQSRVAWPTEAARLEGADGTVTWMVPAIVPPGIGPPTRAWALFEYRGGKLAAVVAVPEVGPAGGWVRETNATP